MNEVLLAVPGIAFESSLVAEAARYDACIQRRCVDAVELLAAAALHRSAVVIVSSALPRVSASVVDELQAHGRAVIGLAVDEADRGRLEALGLTTVVTAGPSAADTWPAVLSAPQASAHPPVRDVGSTLRELGRMVVVWGPMGAPGRTTVAIAVAESLARRGQVLLLDADSYAPSIAAALGIFSPAADFGALCRRAELSGLTTDELLSTCSWLSRALAVVPGLRQRTRWPELRRLGLDRIWQAARESFDHVVVDVGFNAEPASAEWTLTRHAAALSALAAADHVLAVGDGSASGAARLVEGWDDLCNAAPQSRVTVVQNRAQGRGRDWTSAVQALGVHAPVVRIPVDSSGLTRSWQRGLLPGEGTRRSPVRAAVERIAGELVSH